VLRDQENRGGIIVVTLGNADPDDQHLAGRIVAVDDGIIRWLARRERRLAVNFAKLPELLRRQ
jgi:hypothetical protein